MSPASTMSTMILCAILSSQAVLAALEDDFHERISMTGPWTETQMTTFHWEDMTFIKNGEVVRSVWTSTSGDSCRVPRHRTHSGKMSNWADENDLVRLKLGEDTAVIHLFGATVLSWKTGNEQTENLYLSKTAVFDNKKAIRGGVPFVFPNFGPWSLGPQHGFARTSMWSLNEKKPHQAVFRLTETEASLAIWPFKFEVLYTVELAPETLMMRVDVKNTDSKPWDFTLLLHSYLRVSDIATTTITGLEGASYIDKVHGKNSTQEGDLKIEGAIDRVFCSTGDDLKISDGCRSFVLEKKGFPEAVVWNPWVEGCAKTGDLDDDAWEQMVCVEPGKVKDRVVLQAEEVYIAKASIRVTE